MIQVNNGKRHEVRIREQGQGYILYECRRCPRQGVTFGKGKKAHVSNIGIEKCPNRPSGDSSISVE